MKVLHVFTLAVTAESFFDGQFGYLVDMGQEIHLACTPSKTIDKFAQRNNVKYFPIEISRTLSPIEDVKATKQLYSLMMRNHYDIVVGHTPKGALLSMIASWLAGVKRRVYFRHGLIYTTASGLKHRVLKAEEQFVSALASHIINVSPSLGEVAVRDKLNRKGKQSVIGRGTCGGIDTIARFNPEIIYPDKLEALRTELKISDDYVIGFCGRLCKDKGIPELIEGFKLLRQLRPELHPKLLLVGGYDSRDILPPEIRKAIESDNDIKHVGYVLKDLQYYYALMDVFVFPSHREGFGMCSIEAQAMCVPALVARSHGCIDTIVPGVTGEYIELKPQSICDNLMQMFDSKKRIKLGKNSREFVCENFERTKLWPLILNYYKSLIDV